jgi:hypothetical protein
MTVQPTKPNCTVRYCLDEKAKAQAKPKIKPRIMLLRQYDHYHNHHHHDDSISWCFVLDACNDVCVGNHGSHALLLYGRATNEVTTLVNEVFY